MCGNLLCKSKILTRGARVINEPKYYTFNSVINREQYKRPLGKDDLRGGGTLGLFELK